MEKMIGFKALMLMPLLASPVAFLDNTPTTISGESLIPIGLVLLLVGVVWKAAREVEKMTLVLQRLARRMDRVEERVGLPPDPDTDLKE